MFNRKQLPASPKPLIMALEPRILLDGAAVVEATEAMTDNDYRDASNVTDTQVDIAAVAPENPARREVVFVDASLPDVETLIDGLDDSAEVYLIEAYEDGLAQMIALLEGTENLDAIHILGHGDVAQANIGSTLLSDGTLDANTDRLKQIGSFLSDDGDILLYGCNIAQGDEGEAFVERIAQITQADIAASDDLTGHTTLNGDWILERNTADIETTSISNNQYSHTLVNIDTGTNFTENAISSLPVINGTDLSSQINGVDYYGSTMTFSIEGDAIWHEDIYLQTDGTNTGNISFDTNNKSIYANGVRIGNYYPSSTNNSITIELTNTFYNGDFNYTYQSEGWTTQSKTSDPLTTSLSSNATISSNRASLSGNATLDLGVANLGDSVMGSSIYSDEYIPLDATNTINFDYYANNSNGDKFIIKAYLVKSGGGTYSLIDTSLTPQDQNGTVHNFSKTLTGITAGDWRLVIEGGAEDTNNTQNIYWSIYVDNIKTTTSAQPIISPSLIENLANAVHYDHPSYEQLRGFEDTTPANKGIRITTKDSNGDPVDDFTATFTINPINDKPYSSYNTLKGTVTYSTPGYELDIFNDIYIYPIENIQQITTATITIDGINQPTDEYLVSGNELIALNNGTGTFNGIPYSSSITNDPNTSGRYLATLVFDGNWSTSSPGTISDNSYYSSTLTSFLTNLKFRNNAINTTDIVDRRITLTEVTDSGSNSGSNINTHNPNYTTIIRRIPVLTVSDTIFDESTGTPTLAGTSIDINNLASTVSIVSATVRITDGYTSGDTIYFDSTDPRFIVNTGVDNDGNHFLTLSSNPANTAILLTTEWETALASIKFITSSDNPTNRAINDQPGNTENLTRTLKWEINDGLERYIPDYSTITITESDNGITLPNGNTALLTTPHNTDINFQAALYFDDADDIISFSSPDLPSGLIINNASGEITGKLSGIDPAEFVNGQRSYTSTIVAQNARPDSQSITLTITVTDDDIDITGTQPNLLMSQNSVNQFDISGFFSDSDDNLRFEATDLPPGLNINSSTGIIYGTIPTIPESELTDGQKTYTVTVFAKNYQLDANGNTALDGNGQAIVKDIQSFTFDITVSRESLSVTPWKGYHFDKDGNPITINSLYKSQNPNETAPTFTAARSPLALFKEVSSTSLTNGENYSDFTLKISNISMPQQEFITTSNQDIAIQNETQGTIMASNGDPVNYSIDFDGTYYLITFSGEFTSDELNSFIKSLNYRNDSALPDVKTGRSFSISLIRQSDGDETTLTNAKVDIKRLPAVYISDHSYNEGNYPTLATDNIYLRNIPALSEFYGVKVQITDNYQNGESLGLFISDQNPFPNIQAQFNPVSGTLTLTSSTPLLPVEMDQLLNAISFHSTLDYNNSSKLTRTLTWTVLGDPNEIDRYQPETSNLKIIPVLGLTNDSTQVGNNFEKDAAKSFSNFGDGLVFSASGLPGGITIDALSGLISGTAEVEGDYEVEVTIQTPGGKTANDTFKLAVYPLATPNDSKDAISNQFTQFQQIENYGGERTNSANVSTTSISSTNTNNSTSTSTRTSNTADSSQSMTYTDSGLTSGTTSSSQQQATDTNQESASEAEASAESEKAETPAETTTTGSGADTAALSEASLNTTENAAATLSSIFDAGVPNQYSASAGEIKPPVLDKIAVSVNADGQLIVTSLSGTAGSDNLSGMSIVDVEQTANDLNIRINDINLDNVTKYSASLPNGLPLPPWLAINPDTGELRGNIPPGLRTLDLQIQAVDQDGTIRLLDIELTLPESQEQPLSLHLEIDNPYASSNFSDQLAAAASQTENAATDIIQSLQSYHPS